MFQLVKLSCFTDFFFSENQNHSSIFNRQPHEMVKHTQTICQQFA